MVRPSDSTSLPRPQPRLSLAYLAPEQDLLCTRLVELTPHELASPSNLPGWTVLDLAVHITRVCDSILLAVQRATVGDETPAFGPAARPREEAIRGMSPDGWAQLQRTARGELTRVVAALTDAELEEFHFPHPQGQRSISWFCTQLLTEVTFHRWDLGRSLRESRPLDSALASYLLPFMLDPAQPLYAQLRATPSTSFTLVT
ncbi:MAG: maleylpyruvate isomerase family mycothiol-dependent enzyme, partial [Chloroflexi bacterium]|nr:maleylpyruvate isomerase family mycothiol-dependent enzyme [Chloroflexota bacterium]